MMAAFAEPEGDILLERTMAGLAAARRQGRTGSRPTVMDADKLTAHARRTNGESPTSITKSLGVPRAGIYRPPRPDRLRMTNAVAGPQPRGMRNARFTKAAMDPFGTGDGPSGWVLVRRRRCRVFTVCVGCVRCAW